MESKREEKKDAIERIALNKFVIYGYEGTSIRDICDEVGVKQPTLYFYFKSKDTLYMSLVNKHVKWYTNLYLEKLEEVKGNDFNAREKLYEIFYETINFYILNPDIFRFIIFARDNSPNNLKSQVAIEFSLLENILTELITVLYHKLKGDINIESSEELIMFVYRCVRGYLLELMQLNKNPKEKDIENVWNIFINGIF